MRYKMYSTNDNELCEIMLLSYTSKRKARFYHGGLAGCFAVCFTHPFDLMKANLQTQKEKTSIFNLVRSVAAKNGVGGFYNGLSASILFQMTYTLARFGVYEYGKENVQLDTLGKKLSVAFAAGVVGALIGTPPDLINVRMQNDSNLPEKKRRNYKHVFDGLFNVIKHEGPMAVFNGVAPNLFRGGVHTAGQLACYDHAKSLVLKYVHGDDDLFTHLYASTSAGLVAVTLTQPVDVIKTRAMNARPGEFKGLLDVIKQTVALGPQAFTKGFLLSNVRMVPTTILTFIFFEELRTHFGIDPPHRVEIAP